MKRIILAASYSEIEPLGLLHLAAVARDAGWAPRIVLVREPDGSELLDAVREDRPDMLGCTLYTGNHASLLPLLDRLRREHGIPVIAGGPHATYFASECLLHADYVVVGEGLDALRRILAGTAAPGVVPFERAEAFPVADRTDFYRDYPAHGASRIKSVITRTGCPYACTYCYNSCTLPELRDTLPAGTYGILERSLGRSGRMFPRHSRPVENIIAEVEHIRSVAPGTRLIFFQDDVFGAELPWLREFARRFPALGIGFHAQLRFEYADPAVAACRERLELFRSAGCTGLTFAIESADPTVRREILNRPMDDDLIWRTMRRLAEMGFRVRTEQMLGLPCGATEAPTPVTIEADLATLELNIRLRAETGLPTMAWASIFVPYPGTKLGRYAVEHGFCDGDHAILPASFFEDSVLRFPARWVGPGLTAATPGAWLPEEDQQRHRSRLKALRDVFQVCAALRGGRRLAESFLSGSDLSLPAFSNHLRRHSYEYELYRISDEDDSLPPVPDPRRDAPL